MNLVNRNQVSLPELMNEIFKPDWFGGAEALNSKMPAVNIKEDETSYVLELIAPGRKKEDFKIEVENDLLTISSEQSNEVVNENESEKVKYTRKEYTFSTFKRSFTLPKTINVDAIKASYENGILSFNLPKKEEALPKPKRLIELG